MKIAVTLIKLTFGKNLLRTAFKVYITIVKSGALCSYLFMKRNQWAFLLLEFFHDNNVIHFSILTTV